MCVHNQGNLVSHKTNQDIASERVPSRMEKKRTVSYEVRLQGWYIREEEGGRKRSDGEKNTIVMQECRIRAQCHLSTRARQQWHQCARRCARGRVQWSHK